MGHQNQRCLRLHHRPDHSTSRKPRPRKHHHLRPPLRHLRQPALFQKQPGPMAVERDAKRSQHSPRSTGCLLNRSRRHDPNQRLLPEQQRKHLPRRHLSRPLLQPKLRLLLQQLELRPPNHPLPARPQPLRKKSKAGTNRTEFRGSLKRGIHSSQIYL